MRRVVIGAVWVALLPLFEAGAQGDESSLGPPSGRVRIEATAIAAGVGLSWGVGTLVIGDSEHRFKLSGLTVADVGISRVTASGEVWGLGDDYRKFEGTYSGVDVGAAVGGGRGGLAMRNEYGVIIKLRATQQGVRFSMASGGTTIEFE